MRRVLERIQSPEERPAVRDLPREDRRALRDTGLCSARGVWPTGAVRQST